MRTDSGAIGALAAVALLATTAAAGTVQTVYTTDFTLGAWSAVAEQSKGATWSNAVVNAGPSGGVLGRYGAHTASLRLSLPPLPPTGPGSGSGGSGGGSGSGGDSGGGASGGGSGGSDGGTGGGSGGDSGGDSGGGGSGGGDSGGGSGGGGGGGGGAGSADRPLNPADPFPGQSVARTIGYELVFDLYIIDSWDGAGGQYGPDQMRVDINGQRLFAEYFDFRDLSNFRHADVGPVQMLGNTNWTDLLFRDVRIAFELDASATDVAIDWSAQLNQSIGDESWAIDNVRLTRVIPTPASAALLGAGALTLSRRRRR